VAHLPFYQPCLNRPDERQMKMKLKDSGWLEKLIKALKNWKEHATTYGSDSDGSKAYGSDVMTLLFENSQHLDEYQRKFGASTISQQHILHFVSNSDRFTSVEIKSMGGENDYLAFCEDGFLIADFEKWQKKQAEADQKDADGRTGRINSFFWTLYEKTLKAFFDSLLGKS